MKKFQIKYSFIVFISLSVALTPFDLLLPMMAAVSVHEAGHLAAMLLLRVRVKSITFSAGGIDISSSLNSVNYKKTAAVYLGGCVFNILAAAVTMSFFSCFAFCCIAYALINLLPIKPLDGAMAVTSLFCMKMLPERAGRVTDLVSVVFLIPLWMLSLYIFFYSATNFTPLLMCIFLFMSVFSNKEGVR
jgi:Zn-dependent protease